MVSSHDVVGRTGTLTIATRGPDGPGEVLVRMRGGTEAYLAYSEVPLARGTEVLVWGDRGERAVDVMEWADPLGAGDGPQ